MPGRGEVWLVDLGMVEKIRPALVVISETQRR
jgi:mRNA-degrading endonuclease toxin of MazEF toxin-antitoxin module